MLQAMLLAEKVQRVSCVAEVPQQFFAGNARFPLFLQLLEAILETVLGQFRDDDQPAVNDLDTLDAQQERMTD